MTIVASNPEGYATRVAVDGHEVRADEPVRRGGTDTAPSPHQLVLAGLAACTAITLRMYAQRKDADPGEITVEVHMDGPRIERRVVLGRPIDPAVHARMIDIVERTPVTLMLKDAQEIVTAFG